MTTTNTTAALKAGITSMSQLRAMQILVSGPETLTNLAATIGISTAAITGLADKFERLGLAVRVRGSIDRRSVWLRLTPSGQAIADTIAAPQPVTA